MKKMLVMLSLALIGSAAIAAPVPVLGVSAYGSGNPFENAPALIADGVIPSAWNGEGSFFWSGKGKWVALAFDQVYALQDLVLSADPGDSYRVHLVLNDGSWSEAFLLPAPGGDKAHGNESKNKNGGSGKGGPGGELEARWLSFAGDDAEPVLATGLLIAGANDNKNGHYAISKLSLRGTPVAVAPAGSAPEEGQGEQGGVTTNQVPEPGTLALLAAGLLGAGLNLRRRRS